MLSICDNVDYHKKYFLMKTFQTKWETFIDNIIDDKLSSKNQGCDEASTMKLNGFWRI